MAQPENFGFTEEAALLKESARKLLSEHFDAGTLHALVAADTNPNRAPDVQWDQQLWQQMVDLGWTLLAVPEDQGGVGMPLVGVAGLVEELGRAAFPCPLLSTLSVSYVLAAAGAGAEAALEDIAQGATVALVISDEHGSWTATETPVVSAGDALTGTGYFVQDAGKVSHLLVCARADAGPALYWLPVDADGVAVQQDAIVDLTRDQAHIRLDGARAQQVCSDAAAALDAAMPAIWTLHAADMVGAGEWQLQTTVEYVSQRLLGD